LAHILVLNDIDSGVVNKLPKFADDTKLVGIVSSEYEVEQLRSDLQRLYDLSLDWQMLFNTESVNCYILVTEMLKVLIHYVGETVKAEDEEQDLGIIVAQTLKFSSQCVAAAKSANKTLYDQSYIC